MDRTLGERVQDLKKAAKISGELLHAKHAFPPNSLGYCGPDLRGKIEEFLHGQSNREVLIPYLTKFEAAYPFVKMIAKSTGRQPFDYEVTEAYWLGNSLLDRVEPIHFYEFTLGELASSRRMKAGKKDLMKKEEAKSLFRELGPAVKPHHTFYVLNMFAKPSEDLGIHGKVLELMDSCRISWGKVLEVKRDSLIVDRPSLSITGQNQLALTEPRVKEVSYDPEISSFDSIHTGDWVSLHWSFASEKLNATQLRNLIKYTKLDIQAANRSPKAAK